ncbi:hypothetical protein BURMUCGD1_5914 [Burkholderia multivorans CGD1]|nr:hypothetical protein BURMUCGD1_5914 [Burkholderia multivorans CGD1]
MAACVECRGGLRAPRAGVPRRPSCATVRARACPQLAMHYAAHFYNRRHRLLVSRMPG